MSASARPHAGAGADDLRSPEQNALIVENMTWARTIAYRVAAQYGLTKFIEELTSDAYLGLIHAADSFKPAYKVPFRGYARQIVRGAIFNGLRDRDPLSEHVRRTIRKGNRFIDEVYAADGFLPTSATIERAVPGFNRAQAQAQNADTLSYDIKHEGLPATNDSPVEAALIAAEERAKLDRALASLRPRLGSIALAYYFDDESLYSIAQRFALSPQRVSQLHHEALRVLRKHLHPPEAA